MSRLARWIRLVFDPPVLKAGSVAPKSITYFLHRGVRRLGVETHYVEGLTRIKDPLPDTRACGLLGDACPMEVGPVLVEKFPSEFDDESSHRRKPNGSRCRTQTRARLEAIGLGRTELANPSRRGSLGSIAVTGSWDLAF